MKFLILTHVQHKLTDGSVSAYAPYVKEMNIWLKHVDEVSIVAPKTSEIKNDIDLDYEHKTLNFNEIPSIEFTNTKKILSSLFKLPFICSVIFKACKKADHIHLRCPGNIGLIGCLVQICFPKKIKTAKYAGNWDPRAKQPLTYKFQKWLLSNTFFTKNITVLVYGNWKNQTKNIKSFFTATYNHEDRQIPKTRNYSASLKFVFVGSLVEGKRPLFAIQIIEKLNTLGYDVVIDLYGDGVLKTDLETYVKKNNLGSKVKLFGNQKNEVIKDVLKEAHFLILASKSEGWPKAIAEAMFFGVIPIATSVSCVAFMLDYGKRGIIIKSNLEDALHVINIQLVARENLKMMSKKAADWSQNYTLDFFESKITKLIKL